MGIFQSLNLGSPVLQGVAEKEPLETQFSLLPGFGSQSSTWNAPWTRPCG